MRRRQISTLALALALVLSGTALFPGSSAVGARVSRVRPALACVKPDGVVSISFSKTKYPNIRRHFLGALRRGWPRTLVLNRPGADARRERLLAGFATPPGFDRDEYPPAVGRGRGKGLTRGSNPRDGRPTFATSRVRRPARTARRWHQAAPLLRPHPLPLRLLLAAAEPPASSGRGRRYRGCWRRPSA